MGRIANTKEDYRSLFAKTGNQCAFPGCLHPLIDEDNDFIAQVCHIEAAQPGGPRYNTTMTDNDRRSVENLIVLCYRHHKKTDNIDFYDVTRLRQMKAKHESNWAEREYQVPNEALDRIFEEQFSFEQHVSDVNAEWVASFDLAMDFRFLDDPSKHLDQIRISISDIEKLLNDISAFLSSLPADIAALLDELGYDSSEYKKVPYYMNPFENAFWESLALQLPNSLKTITFHAMALEAHICFEKLRIHPNDATVRSQLEESKSQLLDLASTSIYHD